ncbi:MAG: hypothetical protein Q8S02_15225 [Hydrogenophaga sp.]|nr:hypothetical protein [Hydrogenophaga sp.]
MRRFLMWMMICLLPLRLWAGDAMAVQHAPPAAHEAVVVMAQDAHPCHGADAPSDNTTAQAAAEHSGACGDCSVCHGPLAGLTTPVWAAKTLPAAVPQTVGWPPLSAHALPQLKPPRA